MHAAILRLPFFGPLARKLATAQVSRTLATLLAGGIPLVNALDIAAKSVANQSIADGLAVVAKEVREGGSLGADAGQAEHLSRMWPSKWSKSASPLARWQTC